MKLNTPGTGPWVVIKRLSLNQSKPFNGACDEGEGWIVVEARPTEVLRPS